MSRKLDIVNFLRGFSIFTIVAMHLLQSYDLSGFMMKVISFGGAGTHVFILCSRFGLYLSYLNNPLGYADFLRRRFGRIYMPMAILCLATSLWMAYWGKDVLMPLLGNLLLFKMFVPELENSMGGQMWFVSTIIQFYLAWPLIVKLINHCGGCWAALAVSLLWATFVGLIGYGEERVWSSFFLQYLWIFCVGMKLAEIHAGASRGLAIPQWKHLIPACIVGMLLAGSMGWMGFPWKLYNDMPSLVGYASLAIIIYKMEISTVNRIVSYVNGFSYEWYLTHILVFQIARHCLKDTGMPAILEIIVCLLLSGLVAMGYARLWNKSRIEYGKH